MPERERGNYFIFSKVGKNVVQVVDRRNGTLVANVRRTGNSTELMVGDTKGFNRLNELRPITMGMPEWILDQAKGEEEGK